MNNTRLERLINIWYFITLTGLILLGIKFALPLILPFVLAAAVAILLSKPVNIVSNKTNMKRNIVAFFLVSLVTLVIVLLLSLLLYSIYSYFGNILSNLPELLTRLTSISQQISSIFSKITDKMPEAISNALLELPSSIISSLARWLTNALADIAKKLPNIIISSGVTIFAVFLITRDYYKLGKFMNSVMPSALMNKVNRCKEIIGSKSFGMLKGYATLTGITYAILFIGLLVLEEEYAPAIAAIIAFIDFLPILGTGVVLIPWAVVCIFSSQIPKAIGLIIIYAVATIARNVLSPKILGNQIKLDTLTVLIAMYVGYGAFGIIGLIIAPFFAAIIRDILMEQ